MVQLDVNYFSEALSRKISYKALVPVERLKANGRENLKTLYLLHGIYGDCSSWIAHSRISLLVENYDIAVIMPSGDNSFYVDNEPLRNYYGRFIGEELVEETRKLFPLSDKREETFIAGLSMGGYGALRNGLKYNNTFGAIAAMSSALIIDDAVNSKEVNEEGLFNRNNFEAMFGDLTKLKGSDKDIEALMKNIKNENGLMPRLHLSCGTDDFLIEHNRKFNKFLTGEQIEHSYIESRGEHDWNFWDEYIEKILNWL